MTADKNLSFLQEKIMEIRSAIFSNSSSALLKIPTTVVQVLESDDEGNVWFLIPRPSQLLDEFETDFPAQLDLYKKGADCSLRISGKAIMITHSDTVKHLLEYSSTPGEHDVYSYMAVKMKMLKVECFEKESLSRKKGILQSINEWIQSLWETEPNHRMFNLQQTGQ